MKVFFHSLLLCLAIVSFGCGSKKQSSQVVDEIQGFQSLADLKEAYDKQIVHCRNSFECPGYAAKLTMWGKSHNRYSLGVCSGTLYDKKYIITNSHCIPADLKKAGANCSSQIKVLFPETSAYDKESVACKQVVQVYNEGAGGPDLAVIELEHDIYRESIEIETNSFLEGGDVYAHTMNPLTMYDGEIVRKDCKLSVENAFILAQGAATSHALIYGGSCEVIGGNSGSGLVKNGKLIGAVFARLDRPKLKEMFDHYKVKYTGSYYTHMGVAQNIGCIADVRTPGSLCPARGPSVRDLDSYIQSTLLKFNLRGFDESQIEYTVGDGMKLELKMASGSTVLNPLSTFRKNWAKAIAGESLNTHASDIVDRFRPASSETEPHNQ